MPYRMSNGKWRGVKTQNGERKTKVFETKSAAREWEATISFEETPESRIATAWTWAQMYLDVAKERFSRATFLEKRIAFRNLFQFIDSATDCDALPVLSILRALRSRAESTGNVANKDRKNLAAAWQWGIKMLGLPERNPFRAIEKFPADQRPRYVPSEEDFWKVHAAAAPEDQTMLLFMLHTAARRDEAFRVSWSDCDLASGRIRLGTRKSGHGGMEYEWLPLTSVLAAGLVEHRARGIKSLTLFSRESGERYTSRQHYMKRLCRRAGVKPFGFHAIRHLSASIMAREGLPLPVIQTYLRHKSATTTARYLRALGIQTNYLEQVFVKKEAPDAGTSRASKSGLAHKMHTS